MLMTTRTRTTTEPLSAYRIMDDKALAAALADLQAKVAQIPYLREPCPPAVRAGLLDALHAALAECERRARV